MTRVDVRTSMATREIPTWFAGGVDGSGASTSRLFEQSSWNRRSPNARKKLESNWATSGPGPCEAGTGDGTVARIQWSSPMMSR